MHRYASPSEFAKIRAGVFPLAAIIAALSAAFGLYFALFSSPADYQQGETVRIMYIHVPAAIMASAVYGFMALCSASFLIWRHVLADVLARQAAPIGAVFCAITLITGMLWGKPTWGAYWVWDARLTSVLLLLLLYVGYIALSSGAEDERSKTASAWLCMIGSINLPIIRYSVEWWHTLHQPASLVRDGGMAIDPSMRAPLFLMIAAFVSLFIALLLKRTETALLRQKLRRLQIRRIARKEAMIEER
jgi:heme exporter protein C